MPLVGAIVAVGFAVQVWRHTRLTHERGRLVAGVGVVFGVAWVVGIAVLSQGVNTTAGRSDAGNVNHGGHIEIGAVAQWDCLDLPIKQGSFSLFDLLAIPCHQPHDAQVVAIVPINRMTFPGTGPISVRVKAGCGAPLGRVEQQGYAGIVIVPTADTWNQPGGRRGLCLAVQPDHSLTSTSVSH